MILELTIDIEGAQVFSTIDANKGFYQILLTEESSKLTKFITPFRRFCFNRLPFGLASAPEIFHSTFQKIFKYIEGVKIYIDDILIFGKDAEEHDNRLRQVVDRAREMGTRFNKEKCKIGLKKS